MMQVIRPERMQAVTNARGIAARQLLKHEHVQVNQLLLQPGDVIDAHSVPVEVLFYVTAGSGTLRIADEQAVISEGELVCCPRGDEMALEADQGQKFSVLNVKTPSL